MLRALGRFLHGQDFPALGNPRALEPLLVAGNLLPTRLRERAYAASGGLTAVPARRLSRPFAEEVAAWMTSLYPRRRYPLALVGSSNGAAVHLAAALGAPWLPQTFMVPVRNPGNDPDDPRRDLEWGRRPARALLDANPDVQVHHLHDPVQDRLTEHPPQGWGVGVAGSWRRCCGHSRRPQPGYGPSRAGRRAEVGHRRPAAAPRPCRYRSGRVRRAAPAARG